MNSQQNSRMLNAVKSYSLLVAQNNLLKPCSGSIMAYIEIYSDLKSDRLAEIRLIKILKSATPCTVNWSRLTVEQVEFQWKKLNFKNKNLFQLVARPSVDKGCVYWLEIISNKSSKSDLHRQRVEQ